MVYSTDSSRAYLIDEVDAQCVTDGEVALPDLVRVLESGRTLDA